jgi:hypothetical protein
MIENQKNLGVILDAPKATDLYVGANDRVKHNISLPDRSWLKWYSNGELQIGTYYETMGCVSFSANKIVEAILNYQIANGMISAENLEWLKVNGYIGPDGKVNLSDRFTTAMSGTTKEGNSGGVVWDSVRHNGVVPEAMASWDRSREAPMEVRSAEWFRDPKNISAEAIALGKEFVERFDVFYERASTKKDDLASTLDFSPVQVYIPTGCPVVQTIQQACGAGITHAVSVCDDLDPRGYWPLFDHYINQDTEKGQERWIRRVTPDYPFYQSGYACTITQKNIEPMQNPNVVIVKDADGPAVVAVIKFKDEGAVQPLCDTLGKTVPRNADGTINWTAFIENEASFKKPL